MSPNAVATINTVTPISLSLCDNNFGWSKHLGGAFNAGGMRSLWESEDPLWRTRYFDDVLFKDYELLQ